MKMRFLIKIGCLQSHIDKFDGKHENFEFEIFCKFISRIGGVHMSRVFDDVRIYDEQDSLSSI